MGETGTRNTLAIITFKESETLHKLCTKDSCTTRKLQFPVRKKVPVNEKSKRMCSYKFQSRWSRI